MVKAVRFVGGSRILRWEDIDVGSPKEGEILVKNQTLNPNFHGVNSMSRIQGMLAVGVVIALGSGITAMKVGDLVAYYDGYPDGVYAEEQILPADKVVLVPPSVDPIIASSALVKEMAASFLLQICFKDEAGLTQLSSTVEDVFSSGDLPRAVETLANMKHYLSAVGEVTEFANIRKQLEVLEDRLDSMVQPRLTDALRNQKVDVAQEMRSNLNRIGRFKSLELQYSKVHLKPIKHLWEDFELRQHADKVSIEKNEVERLSSANDLQLNSSPISFSRWLPSFYEKLLLYLEQEWKWYNMDRLQNYFV